MPDLSPADRDLITKTVLGEAGDQPEDGQAAIAHVIRNRLNTQTGEFGDNTSIPAIVLGRNAFEAWSGDNRARTARASSKSDAYKGAASIVDDVFSGNRPDPTNGATYFYSPKDQAALHRPAPLLARTMPSHGAIGDHVFYSAQGPQQEDLVSEWASPKKGAAAAPAGRDEEDLVSEWAAPRSIFEDAGFTLPKPAAASTGSIFTDAGFTLPGRKPAPAATAAPSEAVANPTLGTTVAGMVRNASGDSIGDVATRFGAGAARGVGDIADTLAQGIGYVGAKGANALASAGVISPGSAKTVADWRARINSDISKENTLFDIAAAEAPSAGLGRLAGQIAGTTPFLAAGGGALAAAGRGAPIVNALAARPVISAAVRGAGVGAGANVLTSASSDQPLGEQIESGAKTGALFGPLGYGMGKVASKALGAGIDRETANLATTARDKFDIPIRVDQMSANPMVRFMGSVMQRLPFTGLGEHAAGQQVAFNRAVAKEFGETADRITRPVIQQAKDRIGQVFDDVSQRTGKITIDQPFVTDVSRVVHDARSVLGKDAEPIVDQVRRISDRVDYGTNSLDADAYQSLTRKDTPLDRAMKSPDPNVRFYVGKLRDALDDAMERSAPSDVVADLKRARYQWAIMKAVEPLAKKAPTGDISPALLLGKSKGGNLEEIGQVGQRFLKEPPSSGTAERLAVMKLGAGLAGGVGGLVGAYNFDPENFQRDAAEIGGALIAAKVGGAALRSNALARGLLHNAQRGPVGGNLSGVIPQAAALINRRASGNALSLSP
jgi:hypothetical protein